MSTDLIAFKISMLQGKQAILKITISVFLMLICNKTFLWLTFFIFKGNAQFLFLYNLQKSSVNVYLMKTFKKHCYRKTNCVFLKFQGRNLLKVAAFTTFPISIMVSFEIHQRFKSHFLNKLRVSFKNTVWFPWLPIICFANTPSHIAINENVSVVSKCIYVATIIN